MAHFAPPMPQMYDPTMIGAQAYLPATLQQQQIAMQMQQQQQAAASSSTQPHPPAAASHSGGGSSSSKSKESDKKGRKPYTITKPRESWTKEEHQLFLDALQLYERDWKRIGQHIPTKSIIQIRSHAQKHFIRLTKMGMKEYIPAPSRPKRKSTGKTKGGGKSKRQKTGEEDEEGEEDGEDEEEADDGGDTAEGEGTDEQSHAAVPPSPNSKAARSLHGLASMVKKEGEEGGSARKKSNARGGGGSARKAAPAVRRTQSVDSSSGAGGDDGGDDGAGGASGATRRSGRQRKQKRKFEDEEYDDGDDIGEEEEEEEAPSTARRKATGKGAAKQPPTIDYDDEQALEYDDGQPHALDEHDTGSNRQSPYTSQPPSNTNSAPTTPLRTGKVALSGHTPGGGGINQLSQLSPLSQLSQATEIDLSAHMLPASSYNPKLKPYPGLHMRSSVMGRMPMPASAISRAHHQLPSQLAVGDTATGEEGADAAEDAGAAQPVQPEFAKVYSFLGSLFDPSTSGHIEELDKMTPVNKDIVQKLMQNLATNLSGNPSQGGVGSGYPSSGSSMPTGLSSDVPLHSLLGSGGSASRLLGAPKHMRTSSLGSIGSLDALSPDLGHRWIGMDQQPSVSPTPPQLGHMSASSLVGPSLTSAAAAAASGSLMGPNVSPTYLPRSFSSEGLTVSVIPPGSSTTASLGLSSVAPLPSSSSTWTTDKSRPGFASSALVSRLTARSALSPLSVAPLSGSNAGTWPTAASSPTAPNYGAYAGYGTAMGSPTMGTPMSFVGSPGGFFSPSMGAASSSAAGASASGATAPASAAEPHIHQYPTVKAETNTVPAGPAAVRLPPSGSPPNAAAAAAGTAASSAAAASAAAASPSSVAAASAPLTAAAASSAAPSHSVSISPGVVSPSHAGNILASLHSSPVPLAQPLVDPPAAPQTAT